MHVVVFLCCTRIAQPPASAGSKKGFGGFRLFPLGSGRDSYPPRPHSFRVWVFVVAVLSTPVDRNFPANEMLCMGYGKGFDTESFEAGAESLSFHRCSGFSVVSLAFPAGGGSAAIMAGEILCARGSGPSETGWS